MIALTTPSPCQSLRLTPCHLHAVPFSSPPRPTARASNPLFWLSNSRIGTGSHSHKLTASFSKPPRGGGYDFDHRTDPAAFFDENGVIEDMDGYLNYLSLEYDSVWDTKPSWCQPWTIISTGVLGIGGSWLILHSVLVTSVVLTLVCAWWYIFLFSYPKAYSEMIADRRNRVTSGVEDTYGSGRLEVEVHKEAAGDDATLNSSL